MYVNNIIAYNTIILPKPLHVLNMRKYTYAFLFQCKPKYPFQMFSIIIAWTRTLSKYSLTWEIFNKFAKARCSSKFIFTLPYMCTFLDARIFQVGHPLILGGSRQPSLMNITNLMFYKDSTDRYLWAGHQRNDAYPMRML